jgi:branched-subunit amino acid transport protein AzlD
MPLTPMQTIIIIAAVACGTIVTRFLPFLIFPDDKKTPSYVIYLGKVLPYAISGFLVVYCLKSISFKPLAAALPEIIAIGFIIILHKWKRNSLMSIGLGTVIYMILVQFVF